MPVKFKELTIPDAYYSLMNGNKVLLQSHAFDLGQDPDAELIDGRFATVEALAKLINQIRVEKSWHEVVLCK